MRAAVLASVFLLMGCGSGDVLSSIGRPLDGGTDAVDAGHATAIYCITGNERRCWTIWCSGPEPVSDFPVVRCPADGGLVTEGITAAELCGMGCDQK